MSAKLLILRHDTLTEHHSKKYHEMSVCCDPYLSSKVRSRCVICQPKLPLSLDYLRIKRELDEATKLHGSRLLRDVNAQSDVLEAISGPPKRRL